MQVKFYIHKGKIKNNTETDLITSRSDYLLEFENSKIRTKI